MNHRHLTSLAAAALTLASATVRAQTPPANTPPTDPTVPQQPGMPPANPPEPPAPPSALPPPPPVVAAPMPAAPAPVMNTKWKASMYGFVELGVVWDSTKSFGEGFQNSTIARQGTDAYENGRLQYTARNSRIGFNFAAPEVDSMKASAQVEADFMGPQNGVPTPSEFNFYGQPSLRMRHFYFKLENPAVDLLAGQFHDLFGWGGAGFYPATVAYLAVSGEVYNRRPQIKLSKLVKTDAVNFEIAASANRPFQRDSVTPDLMGGVRVVINDWKGARAQGDGPASVGAAQIGVSGIYRKFKVNDPNSAVLATPDYLTSKGWGAAGNLFLPIIPATGEDLSNALTFVAEASYGEGIADMYNGLSAGVRFPTPPIPMGMTVAPAFTANIDPNILTLNNGELVPIKWLGVWGNIHYHFPFGGGKKMRMSVLGSLMQSSNIVDAHSWVTNQMTLLPTLWKKKIYGDANLYYMLTPAVQISASYQVAQQTWADDEKSTNHRIEGNFHFFF